jgi:hypothetical protein
MKKKHQIFIFTCILRIQRTNNGQVYLFHTLIEISIIGLYKKRKQSSFIRYDFSPIIQTISARIMLNLFFELLCFNLVLSSFQEG